MTPQNCLVVAGVALVLLGFGRLRAGPVIQTGRVTAGEVNRFIRGAAIFVITVAGALGGVSLLASRPECIQWFRLSDPASFAATVIVLLAGVVMVSWVWGPGGDFAATSAGLFHRGPKRAEVEYNPTVVRVVVTNLVVLGLVIAWLSTAGSVSPARCLSAG